MAEYRFLLANGKTLVLEGETPPTHEDAQAAATEAGMQLAPDTGPNMGTNVPESGTIEPPAPFQPSPQGMLPPRGEPEPEGAGPGMLAIGGAVLKGAGEAVKPVTQFIGNRMANSKGRIAKAIGASTGASAGASIGTVLGHPFAGASMGADMGRSVARKITPVTKGMGRLVQILSESGFPEAIYAGRPGVAMGRKALGFASKRIVPGVGNALMAADVAKFLHGRMKNIPQAIRDNPNMLTASPGYQTPEDEAMLKALLEREQ